MELATSSAILTFLYPTKFLFDSIWFPFKRRNTFHFSNLLFESIQSDSIWWNQQKNNVDLVFCFFCVCILPMKRQWQLCNYLLYAVISKYVRFGMFVLRFLFFECQFTLIVKIYEYLWSFNMFAFFFTIFIDFFMMNNEYYRISFVSDVMQMKCT